MSGLRQWLLPVIAFLLPWQTRWMFAQSTIVGEPFELGVMSIYVVEVVIVAALFLTSCSGFSRIRKTSRWLIALIVLGLLSSAWALDSALSLTQVMHLTVAGAFVLLLFDERTSIRHVVYGFVLGLIIPVLLGVWQVVVGSSPASTWLGLAARDAQTLGDAVLMVGGERMLRAYGSFPHPNIFGGYLVAGLLGLMWLFKGAASREKQWLIVLGVLLFAGLILTFSRSAWLAFAVACFVLVVRRLLTGVRGWRGWLAMARGVRIGGAVCIVLIALLFPFVASRFSLDQTIESNSINERVQQYTDFGSVIDGHWIAGVGLANYSVVLASVDPVHQWWEYQPIHNVLLLILGELGIIGLVLVLAARLSLRHVHHHSIWILFVGLLPLVVISLFDHYLWTLWPGLVLVALTTAVVTRMNARV